VAEAAAIVGSRAPLVESPVEVVLALRDQKEVAQEEVVVVVVGGWMVIDKGGNGNGRLIGQLKV